MAIKPLVFVKLLTSSALVSCVVALPATAEAGNYTSCSALKGITAGKSCVCIQSDRRKKSELVGGGAQENCSGVRVANFNAIGSSDESNNNDDDDDDDNDDDNDNDNDDDNGDGNPGNDKPVGKAGEGPPNGTQNAKMNAPPNGPGTRGASDGPKTNNGNGPNS
jgi:hypothetical protein